MERADLATARSALESAGFLLTSAWTHLQDLVFVTYHPESDCWIRVHVVTELAFGRRGLRTGRTAECLSRRRRDGVTMRLAPDDAFWALLFHCLLDKGSISQRHRRALAEMAPHASSNVGLCRVSSLVCPPDWTPTRILSAVQRGDWGELERSSAAFASHWQRQQGPSAAWCRARNTSSRAVGRLLRVLRRPGLTVALLGPDGVGKSTLARELAGSFFSPVRVIYMGLGEHHLPHLARFRVPGLGHPALPLVVLLRYAKARAHARCGRLAIFDRYVYDALLPPERNNWVKQLLRSALARALPSPDLVLLLDAPGEMVHARKGEFTHQHLDDHRRRYQALAGRVPALDIVDATRSPDEVRADVTDRIWRAYRARWGKR